ncbi:MAG TPA: sigma-70 family RNA polymerase sigma factor [Gemmataceae bacterium]|nr:sigma-70 family RNA polymerase sigma factor [Gemmataceae bacterium]
MSNPSESPVVRFVRKLAVALPDRDLPDACLLERFVALRDETAFAALVRRHGRLVLSVCRRMLRHEQDAEDAFQATFLVLVRKADSIAKRESVGSWLYGVAYRVAAKARRTATRRVLPLPSVLIVPAAANDAADWQELRPVLDEEINRLPARYRTPVVLCYLEGKTTEEAAAQLGWPRGTVLSRLARARARLRPRLARRGLALSTGMLALTRGVDAAVPRSLAKNTIDAALSCTGRNYVLMGVSARAATLTQGVLQTMFWTKLAHAGAGLLAVALLGGGALLTCRASTTGAADELPAAFAPAANKQSSAEQLLTKIQEEWKRVEERMQANNPYTDKVTFAAAYDDTKKDLKPTDADLKTVYNQLKKSLDDKKGNAAYTWRAHQVLGKIQVDLKDSKKGLEHYKLALEAYPDKTYEEPSKHGYYQHLANEMAGVVWDHKGMEDAEKTIVKLFEESPRFQFFFSSWWESKYAEAGQSKRLKPLLQKVMKIYADKAEKDKENGDLYRKYRRQLKMELESQPEPEERAAGGDPGKKYFLLRSPFVATGQRLPLLMIMPGGDGQAAAFLPFAKQLFAEAGRPHLFAVLSAPQWSRQQSQQIVWPKENDRLAGVKFATEVFVKAVYDDLVKGELADAKRVLLFGWSSAGPAVYSTALSEQGPPLAGYYILSSVFKRDTLPPLTGGKGKRFFLQQGKADAVTRFFWAEQAKTALTENGAVVELEAFEGGHGFDMPDLFGSFRQALRWLERDK